jgi:hypothetical protein
MSEPSERDKHDRNRCHDPQAEWPPPLPACPGCAAEGRTEVVKRIREWNRTTPVDTTSVALMHLLNEIEKEG